MRLKIFIPLVVAMFLSSWSYAAKILIPMDATGQTNHLKAYGVVFTAMQQGIMADWLLNYKGGSFALDNDPSVENMCNARGVSFTRITNKQYAQITKEITRPSFNGAVVRLGKAPKIAVYTPSSKMPWDDAVTLALTYAGIPFDKLYADEVLAGDLDKYDWLHLHHEDFTGQYGKFWATYKNAQWYTDDKAAMEAMAAKNGYQKVSRMQLAVVKKIRDFVNTGGNLFAMCSATETFDIALSAEGTDICDEVFDGDPMAPDAESKLDYSRCFAFKDFTVSRNLYEYSRSTIDNTSVRMIPESEDYFKIVVPSAKLDLVPVMLCQDHTRKIKGFMGQVTAFRKDVIKPNVMVLGDRVQAAQKVDENGNQAPGDYYMQSYEARYIHGEYGRGSWTFLSGHDPEDYQHMISDPVTDLAKHPNSPGYRLILNNVLFPSVKKTVVPTVVMNNAEHKDVPPAAVDNIPLTNKVSLYPNPANKEFVVELAGGNIEQVIISNIAGQEVLKRRCNTNKVSLDLSSLASGVYMVTVNGEYAGKIIKG